MSILAIFQLMTNSPGFFLEGGNLFAACKSFAFNWMRFSSFKIRISFPTLGKLFNWAHFGSTIRSSYLIKPLNIYSYRHGWTGRYTGGAVRPEKG